MMRITKRTMPGVIHGDCLEELKKLPDNSVDLLCTDPPYGYSFMGKDWDKAVPSVEIWKECLRVLKPGAFAFIMSAPRSDVLSRMIVRIEDAGFRVDFTPIYWTYASGFPKAMNIGKMVDKRLGTYVEGPPNKNARFADQPVDGDYNHSKITRDFTAQSSQAKALDGSYGGFQPKPAVEVIIVAMKPLSEKTFVDQALKNGKGVTWLDDCRVPAADQTSLAKNWERETVTDMRGGNYGNGEASGIALSTDAPSGRFPANLLISDDVLNDGVLRKSTGGSGPASKNWKPAGHTISGSAQATGGFGDTGSYSRYFDLDAWAKTLPFLIVPKAAKSEKGSDNKHPTVKPLKLMSYLITLGSRPGDTVLDPFLGSGTTAAAAKMLGRKYIGFERDAEYIKIAEARIAVAKEPEPQLPLIAAE